MEYYDSRSTHVDNQPGVKLPVRSNAWNGSAILFHPRGKPFMFQLDTHGWTEVSGRLIWCVVCLVGVGMGCVLCVCVVKPTLFWYNCYYWTQALHPPRTLDTRPSTLRWGHSWQQRNPNDPQCSSLNQEAPIKPGRTIEGSKRHPSLSPRLTPRYTICVAWCVCEDWDACMGVNKC